MKLFEQWRVSLGRAKSGAKGRWRRLAMPVAGSQSGPLRGLQGQPAIPRHDTVDKYWKYLGSDADGESLFQYVVLRRDLQVDRNWPLSAMVTQAVHVAVAAGVEGLIVGDETTRDYLQAPPGSKHLAVLENGDGESGYLLLASAACIFCIFICYIAHGIIMIRMLRCEVVIQCHACINIFFRRLMTLANNLRSYGINYYVWRQQPGDEVRGV